MKVLEEKTGTRKRANVSLVLVREKGEAGPLWQTR